MFRRAALTFLLLIVPLSIYSATFVPTPTSCTTYQAFTIKISADDLLAAIGMDIRITWD
jgi:hypothetical protein